jgi:hypothetical protein
LASGAVPGSQAQLGPEAVWVQTVRLTSVQGLGVQPAAHWPPTQASPAFGQAPSGLVGEQTVSTHGMRRHMPSRQSVPVKQSALPLQRRWPQ